MTSENREKIRYKINLQPHLNELNCFAIKQMTESDLLSLEQTRNLLKQGEILRQMESHKFTIPFEEKNCDRFKRYIAKLQQTNQSGVYIWINRTNDCGTSKVASLFEIKWDFEFNCSEHGIFVLETTDMQDRILFDFFKEDGQNWLEIETTGIHWPTVIW